MARDYKRRRTPRKKKNQHHWAWLFSGFATGLLVAWLVHVYHTSQRAGPAPTLAAGQPDPVEPLPEEKSGTAYEFYDMLPEQEVVVPDPPAPAAGPTAAAPPPPGAWLLQVGSFQNHGDAESLKANLALLGIRSQILVWSEGGQTWHRVRVGPTPDEREAKRLQAELRSAGMDSLLLRVAE